MKNISNMGFNMRLKGKKIVDVINKFDWIVALLSTISVIYILEEKIMIFYDTNISIIDNIISVFGTLFGFILTCLSIFIVFKTEDKYIEEKNNSKSSLVFLLSNNKFNDIYILFIKDLFSLGIILFLSFVIYFIDKVRIELKILFIIVYIFFICLSVIRTLLSLLAFKRLIEVIVKNK